MPHRGSLAPLIGGQRSVWRKALAAQLAASSSRPATKCANAIAVCVRKTRGSRGSSRIALFRLSIALAASRVLRDRDLPCVCNGAPWADRRYATLQGWLGSTKNIERIEWADQGIVITLPRSKTDQLGQGREVAVPRSGGAICVLSKRIGSRYVSGRTKHLAQDQEPEVPAVRRVLEEDWNR